MSNTQIFAYLLMFTMTFFGLMTTFGLTQPGFFNAINAPYQCLVNNSPPATCAWPIWNPPTPTNVTATASQTPWWQCILSLPCVVVSVTGTVGGQSTAQSLWNFGSEVSYAIGLIPVVTIIFFTKMGSGVFLVEGIFTFINTDFGTPFISYIFFAFTVLMLVFGFALIKPGGHGS